MSLPIDRTALIAAQTNQVPTQLIQSAKNIAAIKIPYDTIDELNNKVDAHVAAPVLPHADGSVTTAKLADGSVTAVKITSLPANSVGASQIIDLSITNTEIAEATLTASKFVAGVLTNETANGLQIVAIKSDITDLKHYTKVPKLHHDFATKANGSITAIDSGQLLGIYNNPRNASGLVVSSGKMVHGAPTSANAAGYLEIALVNKVTRIGATFMFNTANPNDGSITLASFALSLVGEVNAGRPIPSAGIHVTINTSTIGISIFKQSGSVNLGAITLSPALSASVAYSVDIIIDGSTLYVIQPNGTISAAYTNAEILSLSSNYATFELFELDTTKTPSSIINVWADDTGFSKDGTIPNTLDILKALNGAITQTYTTIDASGYALLVTDANTASKTGFYYCNTTTTNAPTTAAYFFLTEAANSQYAVQTAWQMAGTKVYRRYFNAGVWQAWAVCIDTIADVNTFLSVDVNGNGLLITDFNTALISGYYQCNPGATNAPTANAFVAQVVSANSTYKVQYAWELLTGVKYKRRLSAGTWGAWVVVAE